MRINEKPKKKKLEGCFSLPSKKEVEHLKTPIKTHPTSWLFELKKKRV